MQNGGAEMTIKIKKSQTADTRTCDYKDVTRDTLLASSIQHIEDVQAGFRFFLAKMMIAAARHDHTKRSHIGMFHKDFITGFETQDWYDMHKRVERHHLGTSTPDGIKDDVNLIDVFEHIVDCVMAGMGRSGSVYPMSVSNEVLQKALQNTADMLQKEIEVV
jgi:hypothetical protein